MVLLCIQYVEMALPAWRAAGACEFWRLKTKWPYIQIGRERLPMFKKLMLDPLQTECLFGTSTVSAGAAPADCRGKSF